jgi:hypothetical protein
MTAAQDGVLFDITATGRPERVSWTAAGTDDAWLALDRNGNGMIDNGAELFSNVTPQPETPGSKNGFEALKVYDRPANGGNDDGVIDSRDTVFPALLLWQDRNHNGISETSELSSLSQADVQSISLRYQESKWTDAFGNQFRFRAKIVRQSPGGGKEKWAYDVLLVAAP